MGGFGIAMRNAKINGRPYIMFSTTVLMQLFSWEQALGIIFAALHRDLSLLRSDRRKSVVVENRLKIFTNSRYIATGVRCNISKLIFVCCSFDMELAISHSYHTFALLIKSKIDGVNSFESSQCMEISFQPNSCNLFQGSLLCPAFHSTAFTLGLQYNCSRSWFLILAATGKFAN